MKKNSLLILGSAIALVFSGVVRSRVASGQDAPNGADAPAAVAPSPLQTNSGRDLFPLTRGSQLLITKDIERNVIERFRDGFTKQRSPKVVLLINLDSLPESA